MEYSKVIEMVSTCLGMVVIVVCAIAASFFAMAKWGFVPQTQCTLYRQECHKNCDSGKEKSKDALSFKLDAICRELKKVSEWMDKDQDRYALLREFVGKVDQYMESHK